MPHVCWHTFTWTKIYPLNLFWWGNLPSPQPNQQLCSANQTSRIHPFRVSSYSVLISIPSSLLLTKPAVSVSDPVRSRKSQLGLNKPPKLREWRADQRPRCVRSEQMNKRETRVTGRGREGSSHVSQWQKGSGAKQLNSPDSIQACRRRVYAMHNEPDWGLAVAFWTLSAFDCAAPAVALNAFHWYSTFAENSICLGQSVALKTLHLF